MKLDNHLDQCCQFVKYYSWLVDQMWNLGFFFFLLSNTIFVISSDQIICTHILINIYGLPQNILLYINKNHHHHHHFGLHFIQPKSTHSTISTKSKWIICIGVINDLTFSTHYMEQEWIWNCILCTWKSKIMMARFIHVFMFCNVLMQSSNAKEILYTYKMCCVV